MSLCDTCINPGACCKGFSLAVKGGEEISVWDDTDANSQLKDRTGPTPFQPSERTGQWTDEESGRTYSTHKWSCPALGEDGRCTIYENRPDVCRNYEAGSSPLCVMHVPNAEA